MFGDVCTMDKLGTYGRLDCRARVDRRYVCQTPKYNGGEYQLSTMNSLRFTSQSIEL